MYLRRDFIGVFQIIPAGILVFTDSRQDTSGEIEMTCNKHSWPESKEGCYNYMVCILTVPRTQYSVSFFWRTWNTLWLKSKVQSYKIFTSQNAIECTFLSTTNIKSLLHSWWCKFSSCCYETMAEEEDTARWLNEKSANQTKSVENTWWKFMFISCINSRNITVSSSLYTDVMFWFAEMFHLLSRSLRDE